MKILLNKLKNNLKEKGVKKTAHIVFVFLKNALISEKYKMKLLEKYVWEHNQAYGKISQLAIALNRGVHPKHEIINYHQFFLNNILPTDRVLDAGSGSGLVAFRVAEKAQWVLGLDNNEASIKEAKEKYQRVNLRFEVADLNEFTTEEKFDKIVLSNVLEHIDERVALLKKLKSLSPTILLRVPLISRDWLAVYKKEQGLEYKLDLTHKIEYREEELEEELKAAGWRVRGKKINWGEWWGVIEQIN